METHRASVFAKLEAESLARVIRLALGGEEETGLADIPGHLMLSKSLLKHSFLHVSELQRQAVREEDYLRLTIPTAVLPEAKAQPVSSTGAADRLALDRHQPWSTRILPGPHRPGLSRGDTE